MSPVYELGGARQGTPRLGWREVLAQSPTRGTVLIVEDDAAVRKSLERYVVRIGHDVRTAASAEEGDHWLGSSRFDVLLLDIELPRMNGIDFLRWALDRDPEMAVIMLTGVDDPEIAVRCMDEGARTYLVKPPHTEFLRLALRDALALRRLLVERNDLSKRTG